MSTPFTRRARLRALAKVNLDLRVLHKRPDHYHELRTIFQTISLADSIDAAFTPSRRTGLRIESNIDIPQNLIGRAAHMCLEAGRRTGIAEFRLEKRIPIGAGLGGGSSDAAAVLLALPVLAGFAIDEPILLQIARELGSDVSFFLLGGTALGLGRGTELYPLPDTPSRPGVVIAPPLPVSTARAYRDLGRELTTETPQNNIDSFQSRVWRVSGGSGADRAWDGVANDFESVVFEQFPQLRTLKRRLAELGARPVLMTGSGSALFGIFRAREEVNRALKSFRKEVVFPISLVSRARYRWMWWRRLQAHMSEKVWPPRSRYVQ